MNRKNKRSSAEPTVSENQNPATKADSRVNFTGNETQYRSFIENLSVMFYAVEPRPPYAPIYVSPAFERFGYPIEDWRESMDLWIRILHPDDRSRVLRKTDEAMRGGEETDFEYRIIAKNGDVHWVRDQGSFVRDENGEVVCWQGVILDVTDRRQTEEALRESEDRYRQMFWKNHAVKLLIDPDTRAIVEANPAACEFYGYTAEEFKTKKIHDINILPPEEIAHEIKLARSEKRDYFIFQHRLASGEIRDVEVHSSPLHIQDQTYLYSIIHDITERRRTEQELQRREELYRTLVKHTPRTAVVLFDRDFRYTLADGVLLEKHGFSQEMFEGKTLYEIFPPEISEVWADYYTRALDGETVIFEEVTEEGCFQIYVVPVKNECGEIFAGMVKWRDITEQKSIENALRESERRYRDLSEKSLGMICTHDLEGKILSINQAAAKTLGYAPEEIIGKTLQELVPPDAVAQSELYLEHIKQEGTFFGSFRILTKDGEERILKFSNTLYKENGKPPFVLGSAQDITKLKRAEQELRALFAAMNDVILVLDKNGRYLKIAPTNPELLYRPPEELVGKTIADSFPAEQAEMFLNHIHAALETRQTQKLEYMLPIGGRDVWFAATVSPMTSDSVILVARDITERKHSEDALQAGSNLLNGIIEGTPDAVFVKDLNGCYLMINSAGAAFLGKTPEEFIGRTDDEIYPPEMADRFIEEDKLVIESGKTMTFEGFFNIADIRQHTYLVTKAVYRNREGKVIGLIGISHDISERKRAEEALKQSEARYRDLFENANDLIYIHDLRGNYLSVNKASERVFGYTREEALQMNLQQVTAPEHLNRARRMLADKIAGKHQTAYEVDCITKDERRLTLEVNSSLIYEDGVPVAVQGIARDVTERRLAEETIREREEQYRDLFENANDLIYTHDLQGNFTSLNRAGEIITGYSREEALKMNIAEVVAPEYLEEARKMIADKIVGEVPTTYELEIIAKQKHRVSLELSTRIIYKNGKPIGVQGIGRDITERKRSEKALKISEQRYRSLGEGIMDQVWTAQPDGKLDYVNGRTMEYFGLTFEQLISEGWQDVVHPDDLPESLENWSHSLKTGENYEVEFRLKRYDGKYRWHHARATAGFDDEGNIVNWFGTTTDIEDRKIAEEKLNHFAGHDTLTNLPNRAKFMHHLERAVSRSEHNPTFHFAVLFLDLDRFKVINDSLGHITGDKLLVAFAKRLEECVRPNDVVARLGGDEFTVLLHNIHEVGDAVRVANRFLDKLTIPFKLDTYEVFTSASIGIIASDDVKRQPEDYLRDADTAMYRAKAAGKSRYEIFDREMHKRNMNLLEMETYLRRAIEHDEFRVFYQPIINLETGKIREFEALIRWQHPKHGLVPPNDFIDIAEETGLIIPIGKWILKEACRQTAEWQKSIPSLEALSISVNLSAKQLLHPNLISQVSDALRQTALNPLCLKLEVTESMVMENSEKALAVMTELNALGIELSTDDFGTGYSSLSYLHRFPFNRLKIDRSFVSKMDTDAKSEAIVRTILLLGQNLNIETVAEGIETAPQLERLRNLGCKTGQGYLFSKPVDAETATLLLRDGLPGDFNQTHFSYGETNGREVVELDKIQ